VPGVALRRVARSCVVQQTVRGGAHQHRIALPHVSGQQLKGAGCRAWVRPEHNRPKQGQNRPFPGARPPHHAHPSPCQRKHGQPPRRHGHRHTGPRPCSQPSQHRSHGLQGPRRPLPCIGPKHTQEGQRGHDQGHPGNGQQIGHHAHHRHLSKKQKRERGQSQGDHRLFAQQSSDALPNPRAPNRALGCTPTVPRAHSHHIGAKPRVQHDRLGDLLSSGRGTRGHQHPDRHKTQPKPWLQQGPRVPGEHHGTSRQPHQRTMPLAGRQAQHKHHTQHQQGALCGHTPATEQGIKTGQQQARHSPHLGRRPTQSTLKAPQRRAPPAPSHHARGQPSKHGHMQARNAHEMGHPGGPEDIPIAAVNRRLVTRDKGRHDACSLGGVGICARGRQMRQQALAHRLSPAFYRVRPSAGQTQRRWVFAACAHIACSANPLLPQPQLVVKSPWVQVTMGRFQAHPQTPTLTGLNRLGQGGGAPATVVHAGLPVPTQIHLWRQVCAQLQRFCGPLRIQSPSLLNAKAKAPTQILPLGHGLHQAHHIQVLPFKRWSDGVRPCPGVQTRGAKSGSGPDPSPCQKSSSPDRRARWTPAFQEPSASHHPH
jgi:hypothetical protein